MSAAWRADAASDAQFDAVRQLIARGYSVSAYGPRGEVVLARGEDYKPGRFAYVLTVLTLGAWLLVIAGQAALRRRSVVTVWPDGSTDTGGAEHLLEVQYAVATLAGIVLLGAVGAALAAVFSPLVALVGTPLVVVALTHWLSSGEGDAHRDK